MAIIGTGDIAKQIKDKSGIVFLASGLSNSSKVTHRDLICEKEIISENWDNHCVYFSSLSIFYSDSKYTNYKREIERYIKSNCERYTIIRLGNITWGTNPHTLINFLKNKIKNKEPYEIQDTFRYLCTQDEFDHWINLIPSFNCEMNITGERVSVKEIELRIKNGLL